MEKEKLQKLMQEYAGGSRLAFNKLFTLYRKAVSGFVVSRCFGTLKEKAADIEQETWITIWEKRTQFDCSRSFYSFVCYWAKIMLKRQCAAHTDHISLDNDEYNEEILIENPAAARPLLSDRMENLFQVTFSSGGPPHQLLAFGFNKLLSQWKPSSIVRELAELTLSDLTEILIKDYLAASCLPETMVTSLFSPLSQKMNEQVLTVLEDEISRNLYSHLLEQKVGTTRLTEYFGQDPVHNISDWSYKVRTRVKKIFSLPPGSPRDKINLKNVS